MLVSILLNSTFIVSAVVKIVVVVVATEGLVEAVVVTMVITAEVVVVGLSQSLFFSTPYPQILLSRFICKTHVSLFVICGLKAPLLHTAADRLSAQHSKVWFKSSFADFTDGRHRSRKRRSSQQERVLLPSRFH